ncbi:MAG TPA: 2,3-bisphosphoglycerate-independent phosphoglycerate mutase [Bacteroidia bacterium]|nr:2,3-bisphosphoglycerate-independent phosphoglycerate mutase [Bacteroidia bacterium]HNU32441.1 2,3-bisphosphoglycerate-independent phosphoglycerate mutase [Bacteroidia bacterium]
MSKKVVLIIMDGWGQAPDSPANAVSKANTPFIDSCYKKYPNTTLLTHGENVGLPEGQMGNSEVGHLNIGAGRVVYQELALINKAFREKTIDNNKQLLAAINYCLVNKKPLHLMGLVSDGGVHSHINHLKGLCSIAASHGLKQVFIHAFMDGRDTDPKGGAKYIEDLQNHLNTLGGGKPVIASVIGRYYAMDRDKRWERIKLAFDLLVNAEGEKNTNAAESIKKSYTENITDEFIKPVVICNDRGEALAKIKDDDAVLCFNFRTDRCREITTVLNQEDMHEYNMHKLNLHYTTMCRYDHKYKNVHVIFEKDNLLMTLGEVLEKAGKKQIRIAETEKYPHVSFFFSGQREKEFEGEKRILIPSPKVATYDLKPSMSALELTDALLPELEKAEADFICLNFANADMVGHTGVFSAAVEAVETVDKCVQRVVECGMRNGYSFLITADHGNAELMINADGTPNTAHTTNPVPCFLIEASGKFKLKSGKLADLAPTILSLMQIDKPVDMTGNNLLASN